MRGDIDDQVLEGGAEVSAPPSPARRLIFISHANPERNTFATWLATQLAIAGYEVWCDTTKLLGGERFWSNIEEVIDKHIIRLLFVSDLEGNRKAGTLRELRLALEAQEKYKLGDFIIPLKIDGFPYAAMQKPLPDLNIMRFDTNWSDGLAALLKLLERENIPKSPLAGPACVAEWYARQLDRRRQVVVSDEVCHTNWFKLDLPKKIRFHPFAGSAESLEKRATGFPYPHRVHGTHLITFAAEPEIMEYFGPDAPFKAAAPAETEAFIADGDKTLDIAPFDAANIVTDLVRQAWDGALTARDLGTFELASGLAARFFKNGQLEKNRAYYRALRGRRAFRQVVGNKSKRNKEGEKVPDGFWHYALSASPQILPFPRLVLRHHVIFTDDGIKPWSKPERMHKARRSVCKQWWNKEWRDRLLAFTYELAAGGKSLGIDLGGGQKLAITMAPMNFTSPWTYFEDSDDGLDETRDIELVEDTSLEDDDDETA
ncbi:MULTISPECIES: TIR domain-containing protein [unclassified Bradyrhizobium]|uniref:TIR domain-containing protein n=1 Tax=unclassified Bradyrhizobium TaxID=2631580 RepID=UPI0028EE0E31|nr:MULTISPECIES: TIR domain-containing protein [unclassified Bradyrhizobium]